MTKPATPLVFASQSKTTGLLILLILAAASTLMLFNTGTAFPSDDTAYIYGAKAMLNGSFNPASSPYSLGIGFIATEALSLKLGSPLILPALEFLALIAVIYFLCLKHFNLLTSFILACSVILSAFALIWATRVEPDILISLLAGSALLALAYAKKGAGNMLAGFLLGLTIWIKPGAVFILPAFLLALLASKKMLKPFILGFAAAVSFYLIAMGGIYHLSILQIANAYSGNQIALSHTTLYDNLLTFGLFTINYIKPVYWAIDYPLGLLFITAFIASILLIFSAKEEYRFYAIVFLAGLLYLLFGTEGWPYHLITQSSRYLSILVAPMAILAGLLLEAFSIRLNQKRGWMLLIAFLLGVFLSNLPVYLYWLGMA